jgi:hypothetical protein
LATLTPEAINTLSKMTEPSITFHYPDTKPVTVPVIFKTAPLKTDPEM